MNGNIIENNIARLSGVIDSDPVFSHEVYGEGFYIFTVLSRRLSGSNDFIPVTVSDRLLDIAECRKGRNIAVSGQFRSYNNVLADGQIKLSLTVFAQDVQFPEEVTETDTDSVELDGFICKPPVYRKTPFNREISDFLLAVNRSYNKSDYLPCICWGRNARFCGRLRVGEHVKVSGRMQSRVYQKKQPDGTSVEKTAYEISVSKIELVAAEAQENGANNAANGEGNE